MKAIKLTMAGVLVAASCGFAMAQSGGGAGGEPPRGSDAHAPAPVQKQGDDTRGTPAPGASSQGAATSSGMKSKATGMPGSNSTGNMNTKGTGKGTTGTGGPGGSGNK